MLREATREDARFLAVALMEAMGGRIMERMEEGSLTAEDERRLDLLAGICERNDTLYSWRFGTIAVAPDGTRAGASIAYDGADYHQRRLISFGLAKDIITFDAERMDDEAQAGEMYLDTLAVVPEFRHHGVAHALMTHWLQQARKAGLTATLAVAMDNEKAKQLYESMGMRDHCLVFIFGEHYQKMAYKHIPLYNKE